MALPPHTEAYLQTGSWSLPGYADVACEGARFHSPTPLFAHQVYLIPQAWDEARGPRINSGFSPVAVLCGTCRDNLAVLQQMIFHGRGVLPWPVRREFGNSLRALALSGWRAYTESAPRPEGFPS